MYALKSPGKPADVLKALRKMGATPDQVARLAVERYTSPEDLLEALLTVHSPRALRKALELAGWTVQAGPSIRWVAQWIPAHKVEALVRRAGLDLG